MENIAATLGGQSAWLGLSLTLLAGAVGGVVYELLILQGNIELPHKLTEAEATNDGFKGIHASAPFMYDLGLLARLFIGAIAAVAALTVAAPDNLFKLLAAAVVAGSAGISIFRSFQDRLQATIVQKETMVAQANNVALQGKVEEVGEAFSTLKTALVKASTSPRNSTALVFEAGPIAPASIDACLMDNVECLIHEAKGLKVKNKLQ